MGGAGVAWCGLALDVGTHKCVMLCSHHARDDVALTCAAPASVAMDHTGGMRVCELQRGAPIGCAVVFDRWLSGCYTAP